MTTTTSTAPVLEAQQLTKRYGRRTALHACDLTLPRGRIIGLVGPNGAGKSTLLQLACGLIRPSAGILRVFGDQPAANAAHLAKVGFVAQDTPVYRGLTVAEHLELGRRLNRVWDLDVAEGRIADVGIATEQKAGDLSGGQRAQLALALAAAKRPELLILDEPAAALDPLARRGLMASLSGFVKDIDATAVLSSHLLEDVERTCDFLVVLVAGRVQVAGHVEELTATHRVLRGEDSHHGPAPAGTTVVIRAGSTTLVRTAAGSAGEPPVGEPAPLADLILAYLASDRAHAGATDAAGGGR